MEKRNLVQVQYRGRRSGRFEGDAYTYVADAPLEVGDVVNVPPNTASRRPRSAGSMSLRRISRPGAAA